MNFALDNASAKINPLCWTVVMAWRLKFDGTAEAIRESARRARNDVCRPHQPKVKRLAAEKDDAKVMKAAIDAVDGVCKLLGIEPDKPFPVKQLEPIKLVEPPRCHMKPMRLAGYHTHRHWRCQHCSHTKPLELSA